MTLGATRGHIVWMVLRDIVLMTAIGVGIRRPVGARRVALHSNAAVRPRTARSRDDHDRRRRADAVRNARGPDPGAPRGGDRSDDGHPARIADSPPAAPESYATTAACHGAFGAKPPAAARRRRDDDTTCPAGTRPTGKHKEHEDHEEARRQPATKAARASSSCFQPPAVLWSYQTINGSPPLAARRPAGRRCRRESRANRKRPQRRTAACDSLDSHVCHRAKRGAASGQQSGEVTHKVFFEALRALR